MAPADPHNDRGTSHLESVREQRFLMTSGDTMTKDESRAEYLDVSANLRHWNTLRFAELTIYMAIMAAMMNIAFGAAANQNSPIRFGGENRRTSCLAAVLGSAGADNELVVFLR